MPINKSTIAGITLPGRILLACMALFATCTTGRASQPPRFNYQARLKGPGGAAVTGTHSFTFWIYEGGTADGPGSGAERYKETASIDITNGFVNYTVGTGTPVGPVLTSSVFKTDADLFLQVAVDSEGNVVLPRGHLEPVPYAISSAGGDTRIILNAVNTPGDTTDTLIITQPGSYYLDGNVTGDPGKNGISVRADGVTIDLNGYAVIAGGGGDFRGINVPNAQSGFCIRNGSVSGWSDGGVRADAAVTRAEKLRVAHNFSNTTLGHGAYGLAVGNGSTVSDCEATSNGIGFFAADRTQLSNCIATLSYTEGFKCTSYVNLFDCTSSRNSNYGIWVQGSCNVIRCNSSRNGHHGINAGPGCTILDCVTGASSSGSGIFADTGSAIRGCTAQGNDFAGIFVTGNCVVVGNTCDQNGGLSGVAGGIYVYNNGNRIEGNICTSNFGYGCRVLGFNNVIIRNCVHGSDQTYRIPVGNRYGEIVNITAGNPASVNGNSASSSLTTTDPGANFFY